MDEQRLAEIEALIADCPQGLDECGVWTPWSERMTAEAAALVAEVRRLRDHAPSPMCPACSRYGVEVTAANDRERHFVHGSASIGAPPCSVQEWTFP